MLGIFQKDFSQVATSKGYFPKWQLPNRAISQAATSEICPSRSARPTACFSCGARSPSPSQPQVWTPHCSLRRLRRPNLTFGKLLLGKLSLGKSPMGKCLWESTYTVYFIRDISVTGTFLASKKYSRNYQIFDSD